MCPTPPLPLSRGSASGLDGPPPPGAVKEVLDGGSTEIAPALSIAGGPPGGGIRMGLVGRARCRRWRSTSGWCSRCWTAARTPSGGHFMPSLHSFFYPSDSVAPNPPLLACGRFGPLRRQPGGAGGVGERIHAPGAQGSPRPAPFPPPGLCDSPHINTGFADLEASVIENRTLR